MLITQNDPLLIISNDFITDEAAKTVLGSNAFVLLKTDKNILSYPGLVELAQHRIGAELYSILRKVCNCQYTSKKFNIDLYFTLE